MNRDSPVSLSGPAASAPRREPAAGRLRERFYRPMVLPALSRGPKRAAFGAFPPTRLARSGLRTEVVARYDSDDGRVDHAELRWPAGGTVMLGSSEDRDDVFGKLGPASIYIVCDDPDGLHDRAVAAGAEIVSPLKDEDYGSRGFGAADPAGNVWSFGTYAGAAT